MSEDHARRALETAAPQETILGFTSDRGGLLVRTDAGEWIVQEIEGGANFHPSPGYVLCNVERPSGLDASPGITGVALLPDGRGFLLSSDAGLRAFWHAARTFVTPLELASLLAWYHSEAGAYETLVLAEDLESLLAPGVRETLSLAVPPDVVQKGDFLMLRFATLFLTMDARDHMFRVNLNEWSARCDEGGDLEWFWSPVARALSSPRYPPGAPA